MTKRSLLLALLLLLVATSSASAAGWQYHQLDGDRAYDATTIDRNNNGYDEDLYFDLDNDGDWDANLYDTNGYESFLEVIDYDMDENGRPEYKLADGDQRTGYDYMWTDLDQNGYWDRYSGGARRIIPGSNVDAVTRTTRYNASAQMFHQYSMSTGGGSLLYPSFSACC